MTTSRMPERTVSSTAPLTVFLPAEVTAPALARHAVRGKLTELGLAEPRQDDILLATSELVTNAFEHGERPERLELECDGDRVTLRVYDTGHELPAMRAPSAAEARSRGLVLVQALSEDWGFARCGDGKYVWAVFRLA